MLVKRYRNMELLGVLLCSLAAAVLSRFFNPEALNPLAVLLGSVNFSVWERLKPSVFCYFVYGGLELMCAKPFFRSFVVSKAVGLCAVIAVFLVVGSFSDTSACALLALSAGFFASYETMKLCPSRFFYIACFMLLLIFVCFCCFTANPLRLEIFRDPETSMYGLIPPELDRGAFYLSS